MPDSLIHVIDEHLHRYLRGEDSLADFEAWLVPTTWDLSPQNDREGHERATAITLRIAEFTNGDWTEDQLRDALAALPPAPQIVLQAMAKGESAIGSLGQGTFSVAGRPHSTVFG